MGRTHALVYRATHGRLFGSAAGMEVLLLTTTGRRSGKARTTPLTFLRDGNEVVVIASFGGADVPPGWLCNLRSDPQARVTVGRRRMAVTAREATDAERERLWPTITSVNPGYARYQARTSRRIPVVLLTTRAGESRDESGRVRA
jgi:deazaflavin-dependent oxidoreductase (nitroreductase family)